MKYTGSYFTVVKVSSLSGWEKLHNKRHFSAVLKTRIGLVCMITCNGFELKSPNLHQICILGLSYRVLKIRVIDVDFQGNLGLSGLYCTRPFKVAKGCCLSQCAPGARFTDVFSIAIQIRWKFRFTKTSILIQWSLRNFVHGTTAVLSWHVQKICCDLMANNGVMARRSFHQIWIAGKKTLVKRAPVCQCHHWKLTAFSISSDNKVVMGTAFLFQWRQHHYSDHTDNMWLVSSVQGET